VPINSDMFWVTFPDGKAEAFVRTATDPNVLSGPKPWLGVVRPERQMVNIATHASYKGTQREYGFVNGRLRYASEGGKDREIDPRSFVKPKGDVRGLWPTQATYDELAKNYDLWKGDRRLRLFSKNPNRTALIFVQLALIAAGALFFCKSWAGRIAGGVTTLAMLVLEFMTLSRGGILAFLAGVGVLGYFRFRSKINLKTVGLLALGGMLLLGVCCLAFRSRFSDKASGESDASRVAIWREAPRMMAAAPLGWGLWGSGPAYNAWFEKAERHYMIGDLFNDHLSRFVEGGFVWGGLYVFVWCLVFCAGWKWARDGHSPVFLSVWLAYFVASSVNPMNYWTKSFWIPGVLSAVWLFQVLRTRAVGRCLSPLVPLGLTACVLAVLGLVAACAPSSEVPLKVSALGRRIAVGEGEPQVWAVDDGFVLNGNFNGYPGRELRQFYAGRPKAEPIGLVERVENLPREVDRLVLTGTSGEDYLKMGNPPKAKHVIFLTPPFGSDKIPEALRKACDVHLVTGEFVAMRTGDDMKSAPWVHVVSGAQVYLPGWLNVVLREREDAQ